MDPSLEVTRLADGGRNSAGVGNSGESGPKCATSLTQQLDPVRRAGQNLSELSFDQLGGEILEVRGQREAERL